MKKMGDLFDSLIDNVQESRSWFAIILTLLLVLVIGAGSLYMLLNTTG